MNIIYSILLLYEKKNGYFFFTAARLVVKNGTKHFSPLGTKLHFHVNSSIKNLLFWPPTWPPCHVVANQKYSCMHYSVMDPGV